MSSRRSFSRDGRNPRDDEYLGPNKGLERKITRTNPVDVASCLADSNMLETANTTAGPGESSPSGPMRRLVFPDSIVVRYMEADNGVTVVQRQITLHGYELYLVEQWACSRKTPTLVIATYTGDEKHSIVVDVLEVPVDEGSWSPRLRAYLKAVDQSHTRPKNTNLGDLMVTNLSAFPSSLTVIPVPAGDLRHHRQTFVVNEDLKRLGCSGRSGLTLTEPAKATQAKFQQLYKTSKEIPFAQSVTELIKICQVALYMFDKLDHEYIDGLLCDITEKAIKTWWNDVGAEHYYFEPADGILGPSTVAALLGLLMGARNRLHWQGAPVSKDVFDIESTKRGISYFQKTQKLAKSRRLDQQTLFKLITVTTKAAAREGWGVQKAVKSTVTEIGGKRGELVLDMVSGKDKGGLADIETVDMDKFISLVYGERPKWLWYGKPRRTPLDQQNEDQALLLQNDALSQAGKRTVSLPLDDDLELRRKDDFLAAETTVPLRAVTSITDGPGEKDALRKTVFKSVAGKMSDARSGLGRIKDAVGVRGRSHGSRLSISTKEEALETGQTMLNQQSSSLSVPMAPNPALGTKAFTWKNKPEEYLSAMRRGDADVLPGLTEEPQDILLPVPDSKPPRSVNGDERNPRDSERHLDVSGPAPRRSSHRRAPSAVPSAADDSDGDVFHDVLQNSAARQLALLRRRSMDASELYVKHIICEDRWARRMSFGDAEEAVLTWEELVDITSEAENFGEFEAQAVVAHRLDQYIKGIEVGMEKWVQDKIQLVELLNDSYGRDKGELQTLYAQLHDACQRVQYNADGILSEERASLMESVKEIEVLVARLDYEINGLAQKVQDVEDGIRNFEQQVEGVERQADELKVQLETESWLHWFVRTLTGVGTGPNITRSVP